MTQVNSQSIIVANNVSKNYSGHKALDSINFNIEPGKIVGLIGPNGAGKTTLLKGLLGLVKVEGQLEVLGLSPVSQRKALTERVSFIADTAIMPKWLKVHQAIDYVAGVHPAFNREKAITFLKKTQIKQGAKVGQLSKGMITQLHLALIMAIDSQLLILDEPTLGLDIVYRKQFYNSLLTDYYDKKKTIIITTHQVEEVENILTDLMLIDRGKIILDIAMEDIAEHFVGLTVNSEQAAEIQSAGVKPIDIQQRLGVVSLLFEDCDKNYLSQFGKLKTPKISDLFLAKMSSGSEGAKNG